MTSCEVECGFFAADTLPADARNRAYFAAEPPSSPIKPRLRALTRRPINGSAMHKYGVFTMAARSLSAAQIKDRMVRAAAELFHRQGLGATSPDEVFRAAGAESQNFYYHSKSKQGVVHAVLRCYLRAIENAAAPINYEVHSWQDLENWFNAQIELQRSFTMTRSCPFGTIALTLVNRLNA